jgi:hypothetical protein
MKIETCLSRFLGTAVPCRYHASSAPGKAQSRLLVWDVRFWRPSVKKKSSESVEIPCKGPLP